MRAGPGGWAAGAEDYFRGPLERVVGVLLDMTRIKTSSFRVHDEGISDLRSSSSAHRALNDPRPFIHDPLSVKTYRGFLFDADNTLFDYTRGEGEALREAVLEAVPGADPVRVLEEYQKINVSFWRRFEEGSVTMEDLKVGRFRALLDSLGSDADAALLSARDLDFLSTKADFMPHAGEVLAALSARASLGLVTNGISRVQRGRLLRSGILPLFAAVTISEEIGLAKPDPAFFSRAVQDLGLPPSDLLCVGDSPASDIAGARASGIDACWYNPAGLPWPGPGGEPQLIIRDLREVLPLAPD